MKSASEMLLGQTKAVNLYHELCEQLGERDELWRELVSRSGEAGVVVRSSETEVTLDMFVVRLVRYDMDHETAILVQVWDRLGRDPAWRFALLLNSGDNEWVPEPIYAWDDRPSFAEAGDALDSHYAIRSGTHAAWRGGR